MPLTRIQASALVVCSTITMSVACFADTMTAAQAAQANLSSQQLMTASQNGVYAGLSFAYNSSDWSDTPNAASGSNNQHAMWFSGYLGYQYNAQLSTEAGFIYMPAIEGLKKVNGSTVSSTTHDLKSFALYSDLKLMQPIYKNLKLFEKAGIAYRSLTLDGDATHYGPLFSAGLEYLLNPNFTFDLGYTYMGGDDSFNSAGIAAVPQSNMIALGVNYNFSR